MNHRALSPADLQVLSEHLQCDIFRLLEKEKSRVYRAKTRFRARVAEETDENYRLILQYAAEKAAKYFDVLCRIEDILEDSNTLSGGTGSLKSSK